MKYIVGIFFILSLFSCRNEDFYASDNGINNGTGKNEIDASCSVAQINPVSNGISMSSRGIIGQSTVAQMDANFIKLDEVEQEISTPQDYRPATFLTWDNAQTQIVNANILSSPDNTGGIGFRSVAFTPRLTYQIKNLGTKDNPDIVGYISRMVGWYPRTYNVPVDEDGVGANVAFKETDSYVNIDGKDCVVFKNKLDGETDLMMTDMREGRYDLSAKGFKNNDNDYDVQPYGHLAGENGKYKYCNYFSFKHYLTAVRMYVKVDASDLSLVSWRSINNVIFMNQPQTVTIALPTEQSRDEGTSSIVDGATPTLNIEGVEPKFGEVVEWEDRINMPIIKTAMAENDPQYPEFAETPVYPLELENTVTLEKTYMGYILLEPGNDVDFEIHTDAGVFKGTIPKTFVSGDTTEEIFKAGYIYNIVVDMKANGSLDIVVGNEDFESFRNLTPYNDKIKNFEYSNCFIINKEMMKKSGTNDTDVVWYDGFYFQAMVPGRGEKGFITGTGADLYPKETSFTPHSARILWQDEPYLITYVELVHGYIRFSLNEKCRNGDLQGNAVLAAYDEEGNIIWSWHIWVNNGIEDITYSALTFDDPENSSEYDYTPGTTEKKTLTNVSIMNMNLGATKAAWTDAADVLDTYGLYYQWGRKDPSPLPPTYNYAQSDMRTKVFYYMDEGERQRVYRYLELYPTVEMGAVHPLDIVAPSQISQSYANDWLYASIDRLWGYNPSTKKVEQKTIYDPCPYGYRVADDELFALFYHAYNIKNYTSGDFGITIKVDNKSNYFPFSGWRGHDRSRTDKTNAWYEVGNLGDYQDARVCKNSDTYRNHRGRSFLIKNNKFVNGEYKVQDVSPAYKKEITNDYANRVSASPVRCVRYNASDEEPAATTASQN